MSGLGLISFVLLILVVGGVYRMATAEEKPMFWIYCATTVISLIAFCITCYLKLQYGG